MNPRFLADENFKGTILEGLRAREPAVDFVRVQDAGLFGQPDSEILAFAAQEGRILLSHDYRTMPDHFNRFAARQKSPGVFLIRQNVPVSDAIQELILIWAASGHEEWVNRLVYLPL